MNDKIVDYEIELVINQKLYDSKQITRELYTKIKNILLRKIELLKR